MASSKPVTLASAAPYAYTFAPRRTALVLIDIQRDFVDPDGFGAIQCGDAAIFSSVRSVVPAAQKALSAARALGLHVVHTREGHAPDLSDLSASKRDRQINAPSGHHTLGIGDQGPMGRLLVRGEYGHDIVDELRPLPEEVVVDKPGKGSFWNTDLHRRLMARGVSHLIFCGVTTECCVTTTAREANDRGFQSCILSDCTGGFNPDYVENSLAMISSYDGLFGFTTTSAEFIAEAEKLAGPITPPATPPPAPIGWDGRSLDIATLKGYYKRQEISPEEVISSLCSRIEQYQQENPHVWIHLRSRDELTMEAKTLAARYHQNTGDELPPLYGIPFAVKDNFDVAGLPTTAACPVYTYTPTATSPVVSALLEAGAILIGKTNMDQLATGLSGCRSPYGTPSSIFGGGKYVSGGSSSGSGVAVAAQLVSFSLGTDTAGSGRVPAALNGIVGYKPTKGTLSGRGIVPACRSLDTASIFALSTEDARKVWYVVDQYDSEDAYAKDPSSLPLQLADYRGITEAGFTFAVPPAAALDVCTKEFQVAFNSAVKQLQSMGGSLITLDDPAYRPFLSATELLYSGSLVNERIACIGTEFVLSNLESLHPTTKALFSNVLSRDAKPWDVFSDQIRQAEVTRETANLFSKQGGKVDVMLVPTVPCHPTIAEMEADPIGLNAKLGEFTHFGNVLDLCAISANAGFVGNGMPFGVSFVCARGMDGYMFDVASEFERRIASATNKN